MNYKVFISLFFKFFLCTVSVWGQFNVFDVAKKDSISEVVVTGNRTAREVIPVQMLSGVALEKLSVHSAADAIRYFSGVQIKDYGGIGGLKTVNIRSMGTHHTGVFYDGIELGNAQNGIVDLGRFSLENMEAVSLYHGQKSAIFQTAKDYASSGSIYLTSRTPTFVEKKNYNLKTTLKTGSFGTINPSVLWEQKLNEKTSSSVNAEYLYTTGRYKFTYSKKDGYDTTEIRKNGDVSAFRAEAGLHGKITGGEWRTKAYLYHSQRGYPGAAVREAPGKFKNQDRQRDANFFLQSSFRKGFGTRYNFMLNGKYAYDYLRYTSDPRLDVTTMYADNRYYQQEGYISAAGQWVVFPFWQVSLSTDLQLNHLNAELSIGDETPNDPLQYTVFRNTGLTALATALHFDRLKLQANVLGTFVDETVRIKYATAHNRHVFTPAVIASWQPWKREKINFRAFYKRIFRMPTLNDLYYTFIGEPSPLKPEYATQYNLGVTYAKEFPKSWLERVETQIDMYYNEVKDKIVAQPSDNQFRWMMLNFGYVEIRGIDISILGQWRVASQFLLNTRISYTCQKAQDFTTKEDPYYGGQIPYIPWHNGSIILNVDYGKWSLNYSFIYTGERYDARANIPVNHVQPWYTHDVSLMKSFLWKNREIKLTAEVNNLLNQPYEVVRCYPMPGTNFKIIIHVHI